jgi:hypothetical protein
MATKALSLPESLGGAISSGCHKVHEARSGSVQSGQGDIAKNLA